MRYKLKKDLCIVYTNSKAVIATKDFNVARIHYNDLDKLTSSICCWRKGDILYLDLLGDLSNINNLNEFLEEV